MNIVDIISNVGFPIVAYILITKRHDRMDEQTNNTINDITKAINKNTLVLTVLSERLSK